MLDANLDRAIVRLAALKFPEGFDASPNAPDTLEKLCALLDNGGRMVVYSGGSDATIFGSATVNYAFRAWHDWHHWQGRLPFTPEGEREACKRQIADLYAWRGDSPVTRRWARILDCEINGQVTYSQNHAGTFPVNQEAFALAYLDNPSAAVKATF